MCAYVCEREGGREEERQEIELEGQRAQVLEALSQLAWMLSLGSLSRAVSVRSGKILQGFCNSPGSDCGKSGLAKDQQLKWTECGNSLGWGVRRGGAGAG